MGVWMYLMTSRDGSRDESFSTNVLNWSEALAEDQCGALPWREGLSALRHAGLTSTVYVLSGMARYGVYPGRVHPCPRTSTPSRYWSV